MRPLGCVKIGLLFAERFVAKAFIERLNVLDFVVIDGVRASIGEHAHLFPEYFGIDSMSLMLGKNGSGKTRLLQALAEVLTAGAPLGDQGHWVAHDLDGQKQSHDTKYPPSSLGVVYYSPLRYQRSISTHKNLVNASKLRTDSLKRSMLINFSNVVNSLGISSELTASLLYHQSIYERLIIPTLIEMHGSIHDQIINADLLIYNKFRTISELSKDAESELQLLVPTLREWVESTLDRHHGRHYRIAALATLEHLGKNLKDRLLITAAVLSELELATFNSNDISCQFDLRESAEKFHRALNASLSIVQVGGEIPVRSSSDTVEIQFVVDGTKQLQEIESSDSSFQLSWTNLSSGLLSLVDQFARLEVALARLASKNVRSVLVLIDEGDSYLHLDWQRQYVEKLDQFLTSAKWRFEFKEVQAIIATHSPIISGDFPSALVQRLDSEMDQDIKTFGSSLDALVLEAFGTSSIGSKAASQIRQLRGRVLQGTLTDAERYLIEEIGDERLRRAVLAKREL